VPVLVVDTHDRALPSPRDYERGARGFGPDPGEGISEGSGGEMTKL
jgi:hypothetical protein